jgi:hypothetical protein
MDLCLIKNDFSENVIYGILNQKLRIAEKKPWLLWNYFAEKLDLI